MVGTHFKKYPVLSIDFKVDILISALKKGADQYQDVHGVTFEGLLTSFDQTIVQVLDMLSHPFNGIADRNFIEWCRWLSKPQNLQDRRGRALQSISVALQIFYNQPVVVLIDEYDSPMHTAIENGYAPLVLLLVIIPFSGSLTF